MRIVIGGEDEVAFRLAEALMGEHEVVLLLPEGASSTSVDALDVATAHGPLTSPAALRACGADGANVFIACSQNDERNLVACVAARRLGAERTICFLFRRDFKTSVEDDEAMAESLRISQVVRPAQQLAEEIVRIVTVPGALDVETFVHGKVRLLRHKVEEGAPITAGTLREVGLPPGSVLVMARRGDEIFIPKGSTRFEPGDKLTAMGSPKGIEELLFKYLRADSKGREAKTATVIGGGLVGVAVVRGLCDAGWEVKLIESDAQRAQEVAAVLRCLVLHGDGSDLNLLEQERVAEDSVLVAVTNNDEKNLLVSLLARTLGVKRIVTRADSLNNERLFDRVGIDVVRSVRGAALHSVVRGLVTGRTDLLAELEHGDAEVLELDLPEGVRPVALSQIHQPVFAIVGAIQRGNEVIIPRGMDTLQAGDRILVFCTREDEPAVREFFLETLTREPA